MTDRRSSTDHSSLSGVDYVLEGASVRDRFLAAFILRYNGSIQSAWPHAIRLPDAPDPSGLSALLPAVEEESFSIQVESACEPLTVRVIDEWLDPDDDDM